MCCCVPLHVQYMCLCKQPSVYCKQESGQSSVCPPSADSLPHSPPTILELLDHAVLRPLCGVSACWYPLVLQGPPPEDIKSTERGEVEAGCSDMLKCWLRGRGHRRGRAGLSCWGWGRGVSEGRQLGAVLVTAGSTVSVLCPVRSPQQAEVQERWADLTVSLHQVSLSLLVMTPPH